MGAIAVETRGVEQRIPADPANPDSSELIQPQAGQVLYPDSSYKTAQAIRDFNNEGLPVMIFANWRGFSGGSRDMYGEILKFGSMIVDALREYEHPVYIYIPPHAELRGGSWVVVDPTINLKNMEMYADPDSRGGILEPTGIAEIKFRVKDQLSLMHNTDPKLRLLDAELASMDGTDPDSDAKLQVEEQIAQHEALLKPVYLQAATEFCDMHDKTGRMKAVGVIRDAVPWERSREYFYNRAKRRMVEDNVLERLKKASDGAMDDEAAKEILKSMASEQWNDWNDDASMVRFWNHDGSMVRFYASNEEAIKAKIKGVRADAIKAKIYDLDEEFRNL
jgi:acetyl-CoA carboxylase/biotin carboxylase 1